MDCRVVAPGGEVRVIPYWRLLEAPLSDLHVFIQAGEEKLVGQQDAVPYCGEYPADRWPEGAEVVDPHVLTFTAGIGEGVHPIRVGMYDLDSGERSSTADGQGQLPGDSLPLTRLRVGEPRFQVPTIPRAEEVAWGGKVRLLGYSLSSQEACPRWLGRSGAVWQCLEEMDAGYTVFVHLLDEAGQLWRQSDGILRRGQLPTDVWMSGGGEVDSYAITVASRAEPGDHFLTVGMYDGSTGERLPGMDRLGVQLVADQVVLSEVQVR